MSRTKVGLIWVGICAAPALLVGLVGWPGPPSRAASADRRPRGPEVSVRNEPILPIPVGRSLDPDRVKLGQQLFHDRELSRNRRLSCAGCHDLERGGADGQRFSKGANGEDSRVNTPTVLNAGLGFRQFWDGRAGTLEEQASHPIEGAHELDMDWPELLRRLQAREDYRRGFDAAFGTRPSRDGVTRAIADYVRSLTTPNSRFDRWLRGDDAALTPRELKGYALFKELGCVTCHQGVNVGGNMFQAMGKMANYFHGREPTRADLGRFNVTGKERDRYKFKVPSLRNVELTAPYFHDGRAETLEEAVRVMARFQIGAELEGREVTLLIAFLRTLTGEIPKAP